MARMRPIFCSIVAVALVCVVGCDNETAREVPSNAGRGLAPAEFETPRPTTPSDDDPVAARVDDHEIRQSAVERELGRLERTLYGQQRRPRESDRSAWRQRAIEQLIDQHLIDEWIVAQSIEIAPEKIDARLRRQIETAFGSTTSFERHLQTVGLTREEYRDRLRRELAIEQLAAAHQTDDSQADAGVDPHLEELYRDVANRPATRMRLRLSSVVVSEEAAANKIASVSSEEEFTKLAREVAPGRDPSMGWVERTALDDRLSSALSGLEPPGASNLLRVPSGYQVFWVHERRLEPTEHFDEIDPVLRERARAIEIARWRVEKLRELRSEADIQVADRQETETTAPRTERPR